MCPACSHALPRKFLRHGSISTTCATHRRQGLCTALLCRPRLSGRDEGGLPLAPSPSWLARRAVLLLVALVLGALAVQVVDPRLLHLRLGELQDDPAPLQEILLVHPLRVLCIVLAASGVDWYLNLRCIGFEPPGERRLSSTISTSLISSFFVIWTGTVSTTCSPAHRTGIARQQRDTPFDGRW